MKKIGLIILTSLILTACGSDNSINEKELELREKELELKERELALQESSNTDNIVSINEKNLEKSTSYNLPSKQKTEEELRRELAIKECNSPTKYLRKTNESLTGTYKNALSMKFNGFKVKFDVSNSASLVTFKNIKCNVTLSSYSGSTILRKNFTVNEFVRAGSYVRYKGEFDCTNQQFKDTDSYSIEILGAACH